MADDWCYFIPKTNITYTINVFDDANERYELYTNEWFLFGRWRGKCALVNKVNPTVKINSISEWKIDPIKII